MWKSSQSNTIILLIDAQLDPESNGGNSPVKSRRLNGMNENKLSKIWFITIYIWQFASTHSTFIIFYFQLENALRFYVVSFASSRQTSISVNQFFRYNESSMAINGWWQWRAQHHTLGFRTEFEIRDTQFMNQSQLILAEFIAKVI